ncbi:MAG: RsmB/NOP family class I SAM-dependent RNA methyltransferase [Candidatus Omnitrophica bacterium]|nr:RsmB/NOP family class I SAM-dependent RNA methyltransferase [Candidatus Omnitrophota bacterium]
MLLSSGLPDSFRERLAAIIPPEDLPSVSASFEIPDVSCARVNTLKSDLKTVCDGLRSHGFSLQPVPLVPEAFVLSGGDRNSLSDDSLFKDGLAYQQAPSSLLPAVLLGPKPGERVLDACAAPGSKTSQMAAMMQGQGEIVAVESVKGRFYKLRAVCELLGARNVSIKLADVRRLRFEGQSFDKVLVDAPCSSEGRFKVAIPKSFAYWSERKIKEMSHKQKGILLNAARGLKPGGVLVYSTCTFAPEENEEVVDWFLRKTDGAFRLEQVDLPGVRRYTALLGWRNTVYKHDLAPCVRILPGEGFGGFFIACFKREG